MINGDSFAHRAYHALPKLTRREDGGGGGAILGFANTLLRLWADERPRTVIVGWKAADVVRSWGASQQTRQRHGRTTA